MGRLELRAMDGRRLQSVQTRPKDLALLSYLAAARPFGFQRRDMLLALLWPDLDQTRARNALSQALHRLRRALAADVIVAEGREEVGIAPHRLRCDVVAFDRRLENGELVPALGLYCGDFLSGFHAPGAAAEFNDWVSIERERLQREAFNAILLLAEVEQAQGNHDRVVQWLRRAGEIRPLDETIARRFIQALHAAGDSAGALQTYEQFARRLADEYGLFPSAEMRAMAETIKTGKPDGRTRYGRRRATVPAIVEGLLKGRYFTSTLGQTARGLEFLDKALQLDPNFAPAHAARAMAFANLALLGHLPPGEARTRVETAATRALDLDEDFADAHSALALGLMMFDWDWQRAEQEFQIGLACNPDSADTHAYYALFLAAVGRSDESVAQATLAQQLDPLGGWANFILGWALYRARRYDQSIRRLCSLVELSPDFALAYLFLGENHLQLGAQDAAAAACSKALRILPVDQLLLGIGGCVLGLSGKQELARELLSKLQAMAGTQYVCPGLLAAGHAGLGDYDRAFDHWDAMCRNRSSLACLVATDPLYDCVRDDARFDLLIGRLKLPWSARIMTANNITDDRDH
jgi:DNA-binding SARP family transcriptional activator/Tfp pilus assembly protein PilF